MMPLFLNPLEPLPLRFLLSKSIVFQVVQARAASVGEDGQKRVKALVIRTGYSTAKGELVRAMLFPKPHKFKFYEDSFKFIGVLFAIAMVGFVYNVFVSVRNGLDMEVRAREMLSIQQLSFLTSPGRCLILHDYLRNCILHITLSPILYSTYYLISQTVFYILSYLPYCIRHVA